MLKRIYRFSFKTFITKEKLLSKNIETPFLFIPDKRINETEHQYYLFGGAP